MYLRICAGLLLVGVMFALLPSSKAQAPVVVVQSAATTEMQVDQPVNASTATTQVAVEAKPLAVTDSAVVFGDPVRIEIPSLELDSSTIYSHTGSHGDILNPIPGQVAWWSDWNKPCETGGQVLPDGGTLTGDAILAAHRNDVFRPIAEQGLQDGDTVFIYDEHDNRCELAIKHHAQESIAQQELAQEWRVLKAQEPDSTPTLWIVTCDPNSVGTNGRSTANNLYKAVFVAIS